MKICGLTRLEDALLAAELGAWGLGFVFAPSPRRLTPAAARELIEGLTVATHPPVPNGSSVPSDSSVPNGSLATTGPSVKTGLPVTTLPRFPLTIGVFTDASAEQIAQIVAAVDLDGVQLHGLAGPTAGEVRQVVGSRTRPLFVIRAVPVDVDADDSGALKRAVAAARAEADVVLLDTKAAGRFGGTGTSFPWPIADEASDGGPLLIAGGIGPRTVRKALVDSGAWGVDVSSGVEVDPGIKDPRLLRALFAQVASVWNAASDGPGAASPRRATRSAPRPGARPAGLVDATPAAEDVSNVVGRGPSDQRRGGPDR